MSGFEEGFTLKWEIHNFSLLPHQRGEVFQSQKFSLDTWPDTQWYLELYPRGDNLKECEGFVSLHFKKVPNDAELEICYTLALESAEPASDMTLTHVDEAIKEGWGCPTFVSRSYLDEKMHRYLPKDIMTIRFHLWPSNNKRTSAQLESEAYSLSEIRSFRSGIQVQNRSVTWAIQDVNTEHIERSFFGVSKGSPGLKLSLDLNKVNEGFVRIEIRQTGPLVDKQERLFVKCRMTVTTSKRDSLDSEESSYLFDLDLDDVWHFPPFIEISNLTSGKYLDSDGKLRLQCDFTFSYKDAVYHWDYNYAPGSFGLCDNSKASE